MAQFSFDTETVEIRESSYELMPLGWYTAQVIESSVVILKSGNGEAIKLTFEILSDGYRNRKVWEQINVRHTNPKSEEIAQNQMRKLCKAAGLVRFSDTSELHGKPVQIMIKIRKDETGQYEDQNKVTGYKPVHGAALFPSSGPPVRQANGAPANAPANAPAAAPTPPWAKRVA